MKVRKRILILLLASLLSGTSILVPTTIASAAEITVVEPAVSEETSSSPSSDETHASSSGATAEPSETSTPSAKSDTEICLNIKELNLQVGKKEMLTATVTGEPDSVILWGSDHPEIASVADDGIVTAHCSGQAVITATVTVAGLPYEASCTVTVSEPVEATAIMLNQDSLTLPKGKAYTLTATVSPDDALDKTVSWKSGNPSVATVSQTGKVTAKKIGKTTITAQTANGLFAACQVTVRLQAPTVKTSPSSLTAIKISWNKISGANTYRVYRAASEKGTYKRIKTVSSDQTSYVDKSCSTNRTYYYKVKAIHKNTDYKSAASAGVSGQTYPRLNVPYLSQAGWPTGCEATSATMVLQYYGVNATIAKTVSKMPKGNLYYKNGKLYGPHPDEAFVGNPKRYSGYGCYAGTVAKTMNKLLPKGKKAVVLKGKSLSTLTKYVDKGQPVLIWATMNMVPSYKTTSWYVTGTNAIYRWIAEEHCLVLTGYDNNYYYFNDPYNSNGRVRWSKSLVNKRYTELGKQAVIVKG